MRARRSPGAVGVREVGHEARAPADFTTLLVAYDIALSFTIGANGRVELDESERRVRLQAPVQHAERRPARARSGSAAGPSDTTLPERGEEVVGVGDDEPPHEHGQHRAEDPGGPACSQVHCRSIVGRA